MPDSVICFAKDWSEDPTSNHHVMTELARTRRVLWLNSVATRTPDLSSGRDLKKIAGKLAELGRGPREVAKNLYVYSPAVIPLPQSPAARRINRRVLALTLRVLRRRLGIDRFQLWVFLPNAVDYVGALGESAVVYYCVDEWSMFSYINESFMADADRRLCRRADVVFATCEALAEKRAPLNPETHVAAHGVDHALFATALDPATEVPADLAALRSPVIGFYGTLQDWVDLELIAALARRRPDWSFALIGQILSDASAVAGLDNVHLLGRRPHGALPRYCKGFDVGLIPYVISERMDYVNPIKLREYLSAGVPVVSSDLREVRRYDCAVARGVDEFEAAIAAALETDSDAARQKRSQAMRGETWERKVEAVRQKVDEVLAKKSRSRR